jgi:PAT family beta-lactamase induction signal transducer AmpG
MARRFPIWLMGMTTASYGMIGGVMLITVPQLLAARGVPVPRIGWVNAIDLLPASLAFLLAPILDVRLRRRTYAVIFSILSAVLMFGALLCDGNIVVLTAMLFASNLSSTLFLGAQGGWLGGLVPAEDRSRLAAWSTVGNIGGGGVIAMVAIPLLRSASFTAGALALGILIVAPILPLFWLPAPPPDRRLSGEGWRLFLRDLGVLARRRSLHRLILLFASPTASFTLTYTLAGIGGAFHASERFVGFISGTGVLAAGILGSLTVPRLTARVAPFRLYLLIGAVGAVFTLCLIALPRTPATFGMAVLMENIFQAAAFTTVFTIAFRSLGENNPLAATQMSLLSAASSLPLAYMQVLDGHAFGAGGVTGGFLLDSLASLAACAVIFALSRRWSESLDAGSPKAVVASA